MTVILALAVPTSSVAFGRLLDAHPSVRVELERIVPNGETRCPFAWISGLPADEVADTFAAEPEVARAEALSTAGDETLVRMEWAPAFGGLLEGLVAADGTVLDAVGTADGWRFSLRFPSHARATTFYQRAVADGLDVTVEAVHNPGDQQRGTERSTLTEVQRETLVAALETGYFDVPRRTSLQDLAAGLGISDTALSQRLRRGTRRLVETSLHEANPRSTTD